MNSVLTGYAQLLFEDFLEGTDDNIVEPHKIESLVDDSWINIRSTEYFYQLPFEMQWGMYLAFFDSVGFTISISPCIGYIMGDDPKLEFIWSIHEVQQARMNFSTRSSAQIEVLKIASELLNKKHETNR